MDHITFFRNWWVLCQLYETTEERLAFYRAIFDYAFEGKIPAEAGNGSTPAERVAWTTYLTVYPIIDKAVRKAQAKAASDDLKRQLKQAEYLRQYFEDTGREYATDRNIMCPFASAHAHGDNNPSARIYENPNGALVKCFDCGGSWDIFALWRLDNGGTFAEAKRALCDRFGLENVEATNGKR